MEGIGRVWLEGGSWLDWEKRRREEKRELSGVSRWFVRDSSIGVLLCSGFLFVHPR
jgi:hypothetical protein